MPDEVMQKIINRELEDVKKYLSEDVGDYLSEDVKKYLSEDFKRSISDYIDDTANKYIDFHHWIAKIRNEEEKRLLKHTETIFNAVIKEVRNKLKDQDYFFIPSRTTERHPFALLFTDEFWYELELNLSSSGRDVLRAMWWKFREILLEEWIIVTGSTKGQSGLHFLRIDTSAGFLIKESLKTKRKLFD